MAQPKQNTIKEHTNYNPPYWSRLLRHRYGVLPSGDQFGKPFAYLVLSGSMFYGFEAFKRS